MTTLQPDRLKSSRNRTRSENRSPDQRTPSVSHSSDGIALDARPTYDRAYDTLLTLEEAVDR